ncbi:predicted acid phosphatase, partial [Paenibacillus popilliae ATCC 14706]
MLQDFPIGKVSIFKQEKIFKYKEVYVSRIEADILGKNEFGIGRNLSSAAAQQIAKLEILERLSLNANIGKVSSSNAKISELQNGLNPLKFDPTIQFSNDKKYDWVKGVHLNSSCTVFIPSQLIFLDGLSSQVRQFLCKGFVSGLPAQTFSWSMIDQVKSFLQNLICNLGEIRPFGEELSQQAIG